MTRRVEGPPDGDERIHIHLSVKSSFGIPYIKGNKRHFVVDVFVFFGLAVNKSAASAASPEGQILQP